MASLSVIIPVYNSGAYLARALKSLLEEQTLQEPLEVILEIDPSKDDSLAIAKDFQKRFPFLLIDAPKQRMGIGLSRIRGIEKVTSPYFYFMDLGELGLFAKGEGFGPFFIAFAREADDDVCGNRDIRPNRANRG